MFLVHVCFDLSSFFLLVSEFQGFDLFSWRGFVRPLWLCEDGNHSLGCILDCSVLLQSRFATLGGNFPSTLLQAHVSSAEE